MADDKVHIPGVQEVVRNGKQNWQVMHAFKYLGFFSAFDDALKAKAQAMGMTSAQLTKMHMKSSTSQKSQTDSPQKCKGITRIIRGGRTLWQAQDTTNCAYIGTSDSAAGAAALLKAHHGESPVKRPRNQWYPRDRQVDHFKAMLDIYTDKHGKPILPSDVDASIDMEKQYPNLIDEAPALYYIASMTKHGPSKKSICLRWSEVYNKDAEESTAMNAMKSLKLMKSMLSKLSLRSLKDVTHLQESDLDCLIQLLQIVASDIVDTDILPWNRNVGHGNSYYSGPLVFLSRFLEVIIKDGDKYGPCQKHNYHVCREKINACHHAGVILNRMPIQRPLDLKTYAKFVGEAMQDLATLHPPGLNPDMKYSIPWILRCRLLGLIGAKSVSSLTSTKSDTLDLVVKAFPDAKDWMDLYSKGASSIHKLIKELNYKHGIELMTGFFCLFGDTDVLKYSPDYLEKHKDSLKGQLKKYVQEHGLNPHPAILLKVFTKGIGPMKRPAVAEPIGPMKRPAVAEPIGLMKRPAAAEPIGPMKRPAAARPDGLCL